MNIIADENLAFTDYFFADFARQGSFGEIRQMGGRLMRQQDVQQAQALLVRSVTPVNAALIENTAIEFVGSATIGTDHIDQQALAAQHIVWSNAAGCNAQAVAEYVITAIHHLRPTLFDAQETAAKPDAFADASTAFCLGIIGLGNVGQRLAHLAQLLGWQVVAYDPHVQLAGISQNSLEQVLMQADAVSLHVPLTHTGDHATYHLINQNSLSLLKPSCILINSARGPVLAEAALMEDIQRTGRDVVLDVFEHEPEISQQLLDLLRIATPHIAGYSLEGKARGTQMIYEAFCRHFQFEADKDFRTQLPTAEDYFSAGPLKAVLAQRLTQIYDIAADDARLRSCMVDGKVQQQAFDQLRKTYPLRREWAAHAGPAL